MRITLSMAVRALRALVFVTAASATLPTAASSTWAAETSINVKADQAAVIAVRGDPATVVIGNPLYAEVTVGEGMIVIHGRQFGTTNVMVLDNAGNMLGEYEINVVRGGSRNVTVYRAGSPNSYLCAPGCETALQVGDGGDYFDAVKKAVTDKNSLSTGASKSSD